jgi:hypothetical protein
MFGNVDRLKIMVFCIMTLINVYNIVISILFLSYNNFTSSAIPIILFVLNLFLNFVSLVHKFLLEDHEKFSYKLLVILLHFLSVTLNIWMLSIDLNLNLPDTQAQIFYNYYLFSLMSVIMNGVICLFVLVFILVKILDNNNNVNNNVINNNINDYFDVNIVNTHSILLLFKDIPISEATQYFTRDSPNDSKDSSNASVNTNDINANDINANDINANDINDSANDSANDSTYDSANDSANDSGNGSSGNGSIGNGCNNSCGICFLDYGAEDIVRKLGCNHFYHKECIDEWLKQRLICPYCCQDITVSKPLTLESGLYKSNKGKK